MSAERALIDTNVLIYTVDTADLVKHGRSIRLVRGLAETNGGALCAQVLGEYLNVVSKKFARLFELKAAREQVSGLADVFPVHDTTPEVVLEAARGMERYGFSYYDAQVWAVARLHDIPLVLSEDFAHGTVIEGVRFENPFLEDPCE